MAVVWKSDGKSPVVKSKVAQTSVREVSNTVWLSIGDLSGQFIEKIGTTSEHPFYVEGRGWMPAKEIGIGSSIVTRAGPSVRVLDVEVKHEKVLVYNFTVEGTHSYFVGKSQLWVHNAVLCNKDLAVKIADHAYDKHVDGVNHVPEYDVFGPRPTKQDFTNLAESIMDDAAGANVKQLGNGRKAYWDDTTETVVIRNDLAPDRSTAFRPAQGRAYFDGL